MTKERFSFRTVSMALCVLGLLLVYVLQKVDYLGLVAATIGTEAPSPTLSFAANRTIRLIINDLLCISLIRLWFNDERFSRLAWWVFLIELFIVLPIYLTLKLAAEGPTEISSPLFQPLHRMIVNPLLMIILMGGMYYQRRRESNL